MNQQAKDFFSTQLKNLPEQLKVLNQRHQRISAFRILFFIIAIIVLVYLANDRQGTWLTLSFFTCSIIFALLIKKHNQVTYQRKLTKHLLQINEDEMKRLEGNWKEIDEKGNEFVDNQHPYSSDLDLFGKSSLFQYLNHTATIKGKQQLASWLRSKTGKEEIIDRQTAVQELSSKIEWRQEYQAKGLFSKNNDTDLNSMLDWIKAPVQFLPHKINYFFLFTLPIIPLGTIIATILYDIPFAFIIYALIPNFILIGRNFKKIKKDTDATVKSLQTLKPYAGLLQSIEGETFENKKLQALKERIVQKQYITSTEILKLSRILTHLEARENAYFFIFVNIPFLYELIWMMQLEKWKIKNKTHLPEWLEVLAEFDALNSLAAFAYLNPQYTYPTVSKEEFNYQASQIGHPLIHAKDRICNTFELKGKGSTTIITGSNMSGKTTFQRTLGINAVLAFMGAPVCAEHLVLSHFNVFTSMRIQDSLEENISSFYAELKRIKQLLDNLADGEETLFLLDELLRGTNSQDRHDGVKAIILQLRKTSSFGLISTHDLSLASLEKEYPDWIANYSFNSQIIENKLIFDYHLSKEVCHSFSATKLMESIGIKMNQKE